MAVSVTVRRPSFAKMVSGAGAADWLDGTVASARTIANVTHTKATGSERAFNGVHLSSPGLRAPVSLWPVLCVHAGRVHFHRVSLANSGRITRMDQFLS